MSRNKRRARISLSKKIERDMERIAREERKQIREEQIAKRSITADTQRA